MSRNPEEGEPSASYSLFIVSQRYETCSLTFYEPWSSEEASSLSHYCFALTSG